MTPIVSRPYRRWMAPVLAVVFLNLFITVDAPAPFPPWNRLVFPSLEVWGLLFLLSLLPLFGIKPSRRVILPALVILILCRLFRFGDVLVPVYFNRPFNLYIDSGYLPDLLHLLVHSFSTEQLALLGGGALAVSAVACWGVYKALVVIARAFSFPRWRIGFWGLTLVLSMLVAGYLAGGYPAGLPPPATSLLPRLTAEFNFIRRIKAVKAQGLSAVNMASATIPEYDAPLVGLAGADVHLFLVESYGLTLYQHREHSKRFRPVRDRFLSGLRGAGLRMVSSCLRSPTFGGTSWLAFGTLESGVWVPDQLRYHFLLNSRVRPMADFFREAGYRTVSVMPGTTLPWPEGAFFSYEKSYYAKDLGYRGPSFGWSPMADQFVLDRIRWWEIQPGRRPLFARYVLISTHAPFHIQPPYVPNWEAIGDGAAYHRMEPVTYPINWPDLTRAGGAYVRSMGYEFDVLKDYLVRFVGKNALVIIMGDHQPNAQITGEDAPWLVPVHAISANPSLLAPFVDQGYVPGMGPGDTLACRGMDEFLPGFLDAFSR